MACKGACVSTHSVPSPLCAVLLVVMCVQLLLLSALDACCLRCYLWFCLAFLAYHFKRNVNHMSFLHCTRFEKSKLSYWFPSNQIWYFIKEKILIKWNLYKVIVSIWVWKFFLLNLIIIWFPLLSLQLLVAFKALVVDSNFDDFHC